MSPNDLPTPGAGFLNTDKVVEQFNVTPGMTIADFGSGTGYFALKMAKKIGNDGKVYAIDVLTTALESVRSQAKMQGIFNIETIRANLEVLGSTKIPDNSCDFVLMANVLFQSQQKADIVAEAKRILKPGGAMVFIEWRPDVKIGPSEGHRISPTDARHLAESQKLTLEHEIDAGSHHYGLMFRK